MLTAAELPQLSMELARLEALRRLTLYGNPCAAAAAYPDALIRAMPRLLTLDHVPLPAAALLDDGASSRGSVSEAVDAIVNAALAQHHAQVAKQAAAHLLPRRSQNVGRRRGEAEIVREPRLHA